MGKEEEVVGFGEERGRAHFLLASAICIADASLFGLESKLSWERGCGVVRLYFYEMTLKFPPLQRILTTKPQSLPTCHPKCFHESDSNPKPNLPTSQNSQVESLAGIHAVYEILR